MPAATERHRYLISELLSRVNSREREVCLSLAEALLVLGYLPRRDRVRGYTLSFWSHHTRQTIAKIGALGDTGRGALLYGLKFYACQDPPPKFSRAVVAAIAASGGRYRCRQCRVCGAAEAERGYECVLPNGEPFRQCGAYMVKIPDLSPEDMPDFGGLLREQHDYFLSRIRWSSGTVGEARP